MKIDHIASFQEKLGAWISLSTQGKEETPLVMVAIINILQRDKNCDSELLSN